MQADTKCNNCGRDFADHEYVDSVIVKGGEAWKCPEPHIETGYGAYKGGDPRLFSPDAECCSADELAAHRAACDKWGDNEAVGRVSLVTDARFGIGVYQFHYDQFFEEVEE